MLSLPGIDWQNWGETVFYYAHKARRAKMFPRWRVGVFLGRSWDSDQNILGLADGSTARARAMVRVVESRRWSRDRIIRIKTVPITETPIHQDTIEDSHAPHTNHDAPLDAHADADLPLNTKRIKFTRHDLEDVG